MSFTPSGSAHPSHPPLPAPASPLSAPPVWRVAPRRPASAAPAAPAGGSPAVRIPAPAGQETGSAPHLYHRRLAGESGVPAWQVTESLLAEIEPGPLSSRALGG